jgi:hypothetical protein
LRTDPPFQRKVLQRASPWPFVGMAGMAAVLFLYAFSGLLAPWWFVCFLLIVWLVHFVLAVRWFTPHPKRLLALPVSAALLWFGLLNAGSAIFGFTA